MGQSNVFSLFTSGGRVSQSGSQSLCQSLVPYLFPEGRYPSLWSHNLFLRGTPVLAWQGWRCTPVTARIVSLRMIFLLLSTYLVLWEGTVFTGVCLFTTGGYPISIPQYFNWFHVLSGGTPVTGPRSLPGGYPTLARSGWEVPRPGMGHVLG